MVEGNPVLASAVIIPEAEDGLDSPPLSAKRRRSPSSHGDQKRPRISAEPAGAAVNSEPGASPLSERRDRRAGKDVDERKRGKRLFGALIGTLSNNSSSTAQRRRLDIEKKQKEKLKLQSEDDDQKKQSRLDGLVQARRQEQIDYDKQSMLIRQSNMLATAHFLSTETEPKLYYKPWELTPEEESRIKLKIEEAEAAIDRELLGSETKVSDTTDTATMNPPAESAGNPSDKEETVGDAANEPENPDHLAKTNANVEPLSNTNEAEEAVVETEASKDISHEFLDDGGDQVMEGEEETVIY